MTYCWQYVHSWVAGMTFDSFITTPSLMQTLCCYEPIPVQSVATKPVTEQHISGLITDPFWSPFLVMLFTVPSLSKESDIALEAEADISIFALEGPNFTFYINL